MLFCTCSTGWPGVISAFTLKNNSLPVSSTDWTIHITTHITDYIQDHHHVCVLHRLHTPSQHVFTFTSILQLEDPKCLTEIFECVEFLYFTHKMRVVCAHHHIGGCQCVAISVFSLQVRLLINMQPSILRFSSSDSANNRTFTSNFIACIFVTLVFYCQRLLIKALLAASS